MDQTHPPHLFFPLFFRVGFEVQTCALKEHSAFSARWLIGQPLNAGQRSVLRHTPEWTSIEVRGLGTGTFMMAGFFGAHMRMELDVLEWREQSGNCAGSNSPFAS
eukprot:1149983-Pelagomonas_calceolata.AAC.4